MSKEKIAGLLTIVIVLGIVTTAFDKYYEKKAEEKLQQQQIVQYKDYGIYAKVKGDFVEVVDTNSIYIEKGVSTTGEVDISYYRDNQSVPNIDVKSKGVYLVKYSIRDEEKSRYIHRVVIVK